jgi:hypothetical protein
MQQGSRGAVVKSSYPVGSSHELPTSISRNLKYPTRKYLYTSKDTWLGAKQDLCCCGSVYNLTMDPLEKYDMFFNGAVSSRLPTTSRVGSR